MSEMTPEQALKVFHDIAEAVALNGPDRRKAQAAEAVFRGMIEPTTTTDGAADGHP